MARRITVALLLACVCMHSSAALAWNDTGHMTVALIAYRRLTDRQKKQIAEILKGHPHYQSFLLAGKPADVDDGQWAFLKAATWADFVRPGKSGSKPESITKYHHGPWHYIDRPWILPQDKDLFEGVAPKLDASNILTELPQCVAKFGRSDSSAEDRAVYLCWIEHLVGDLHQPLHCIGVYSEHFRQSDMGGTALAIRAGDKPLNFHGYWDDLLGTSTSYTAIDFLETTITAAPVHDPAKMRELKEHPSLDSWVDESYQLAKGIVYLNGTLRTASWRAWDNGQIKKEDVPELPTGYAANARELACRRVALAGYRLATILDQSLR